MPDINTTRSSSAQPVGHPWAKLMPWTKPDEPASADGYDRYPRWPVVLLAAGAFVAIWGGWVDLGRMAGFGPVNLLPGIADVYVDLAITLPLGMEVYAAYALGVFLTHRHIRPQARKFAGVSVVFSLIIGAGGQVAYHLLSAAGVERAPWPVVVVVACVPVAVMGLGAALAHLLAPVPTRHEVEVESELVKDDGMSPAELENAREAIEETSRPALAPVTVPEASDQDSEQVSQNDEPMSQAEDDLDRDERDQRIVELARSGEFGSERELARVVPCSRSTVNRVLRRYNVSIDRQEENVLVAAGPSA